MNRWQFSILSVLAVTTAVAGFLGIARMALPEEAIAAIPWAIAAVLLFLAVSFVVVMSGWIAAVLLGQFVAQFLDRIFRAARRPATATSSDRTPPRKVETLV